MFSGVNLRRSPLALLNYKARAAWDVFIANIYVQAQRTKFMLVTVITYTASIFLSRQKKGRP